jgi:hypothetical protein
VQNTPGIEKEAMKIELKNVKYFAAGSDETNCFTATVYIDGVKAGDAQNHGTGGPTDVHPLTLEQKLNEYGATLPKKVHKFAEGDFEYEQNAETLIDELLDDYLIEKDLKRRLTNRVLYTKVGQKGIYESQAFNAATLKMILTDPTLREKWHINQLLNTLPLAEALALYKEQG